MSVDLLVEKIKEKQNPSVAGLDPKIEYVPDFIKIAAYKKVGKNPQGAALAMLEFNKGLIDALYDVVPAVKPQSAMYEMYGVYGEEALSETIEYARAKGLYVILDVKRNDIGSTAEAYSAAYLGKTMIEGAGFASYNVDSVTVNPYPGTDGVMPFIKDCVKYDKSIFVLAKTSNPSSGDFQDLKIGKKAIYELVAEKIDEWNAGTVGKSGYGACGAVVGATYPEQAKILRKIMPHSYFLVPGYGAQGGGAKDTLNCFNKDGLGAIVNSSRGIMCAYKKKGLSGEAYAEAAREEAERMRDEIISVL